MVTIGILSVNNKRIFIVSEYIHSEQNSTGYYWSKLIKRLSSSIDTKIISPKRNEKSTSYHINNVEHLHVNFIHLKSKKVLAKAFSQITQLFGFIINILLHVKRGELVFSGTNPPLLLLCLALLKRVKKFKWLILVHDVFPENFVPARVIKKDSLIYKLLFKLFNWAYSSADEIVVIGRDMEVLLNQKTNNSVNISFIANWVDIDEVKPVEKNSNKYIQQLGWQDKVVFYFFGNMGRLQGIDNLLTAISKVSSSKAAFLFLGNGPLVSIVQKKIAENSMLPLAYLGEVSLDDRELGLNAGDVALISLDDGMLGLGVPSKSYFSMAADKPLLVIADPSSEISMLVEEESIGWHCGTNSPSELALLIDNICESADFSTLNSSRALLLNQFTEEICLDQFESLIINILNRE